MGCGKSTVSKFLGIKLGMHEFDTDIRIEEEQGFSIAEIFEKYGEEYFRTLETKLLEELSQEKYSIIACGGGMAVRTENVGLMKQNGTIVMLTAEPETILERVSSSDARPLLNGHMNLDYIKELMSKRIGIYAQAADIKVRTDDKNPREIAEEIARRIH